MRGMTPSQRRLSLSVKFKANYLIFNKVALILDQLHDLLQNRNIMKTGHRLLIEEVRRKSGIRLFFVSPISNLPYLSNPDFSLLLQS
jgi:hypothetical protein